MKTSFRKNDLRNTFAIDRRNSALLVKVTGSVSDESLGILDGQLKDFIAREGTMPTVLDFTDVLSVDVTPDTMIDRGKARSWMSGHPMALVTTDMLLFGLLRVYSTHQDIAGEKPPIIVRSLREAFQALSLTDPEFVPMT